MSNTPTAIDESTILKVFVAVLCGICLVTVAQLQPAWAGGWLNLLLLGMLTVLASAWSVRVRALELELTPTDPFILFALATHGTHMAVALAVVAVAGAAAWRGRRQRLIQHVFNFAALPVAAGLAGSSYAWMAGRPGLAIEAALAPLAGATLVYLLVNTALTAGAIALSKETSFGAVFTRCLRWSLWPMLTALSVALLMLLLVQAMGPWGLAFSLPPVLALAGAQRFSRTRLDAQHPGTESMTAGCDAVSPGA